MNYDIIIQINDYFKLPIYYNDKKVEIKKNIISDLELIETIDESCNSIYSFCFNNDTDVSKKITEQISNVYTTDINFLRDNQKLLKHYNREKSEVEIPKSYESFLDIWSELKIKSGFKEKYFYIDLKQIEFLNTSELFLQFISVYNLFSPIISLLMPIIILIIPFIILKIKSLPVTVNEYVNILITVLENNAIGKLFTVNFEEINIQEKIYIFISAGLYLFSIYQNIIVCIRFNNNMKTIHNIFKEISLYLNNTLYCMNNYLLYSNNLQTHKIFNDNLKNKIIILENINNKIKCISEYNLFNISKFKEIGYILKYFYELHSNKSYEDAIMYSIGFNGYIDCLESLQNNIKEKKINFATIIKNSKNIKNNIFKNSYYPCYIKPVKNTILFDKTQIITGPNASGKTTILKSTLINIILTQQFGCGFYESSNFVPFKHIHCYLNIPDTSGRDSLFQAEARRCKEILDIISKNKTDSHFCAFDELYSGTNPEEAEISATSFMIYLEKYTNVSTVLTTHFIKVCQELTKIKSIQNYKMDSKQNNNKLKYLYKLKKGISNVKGGINVLTEMNYPIEILSQISNNRENLNTATMSA